MGDREQETENREQGTGIPAAAFSVGAAICRHPKAFAKGETADGSNQRFEARHPKDG